MNDAGIVFTAPALATKSATALSSPTVARQPLPGRVTTVTPGSMSWMTSTPAPEPPSCHRPINLTCCRTMDCQFCFWAAMLTSTSPGTSPSRRCSHELKPARTAAPWPSRGGWRPMPGYTRPAVTAAAAAAACRSQAPPACATPCACWMACVISWTRARSQRSLSPRRAAGINTRCPAAAAGQPCMRKKAPVRGPACSRMPLRSTQNSASRTLRRPGSSRTPESLRRRKAGTPMADSSRPRRARAASKQTTPAPATITGT